jgi:hypothetical protein
MLSGGEMIRRVPHRAHDQPVGEGMVAGNGANLADIVETLLQVVLVGDEFQRTEQPFMRASPTMG